MFGYININQEELSFENKKAYQAYYCGLCRKLKESCGIKGQMLLNYDMTFLIVLLTGLYELPNEEGEFICALHPTKKQLAYVNEATSYAADINLMISYQNFGEQICKETSYTKLAISKLFEKDYERILKTYPRQVKAMQEFKVNLELAKKTKECNLDFIAGLMGEMIGEILAWKDDEWADELRYLGFYLGKYIYMMDSYKDLEFDGKNQIYNPLFELAKQSNQNFETFCKLVLSTMVSECAKSFERLPVLIHADILRNILYSGVWSKYEYLQLKKSKKNAKLKTKNPQK